MYVSWIFHVCPWDEVKLSWVKVIMNYYYSFRTDFIVSVGAGQSEDWTVIFILWSEWIFSSFWQYRPLPVDCNILLKLSKNYKNKKYYIYWVNFWTCTWISAEWNLTTLGLVILGPSSVGHELLLTVSFIIFQGNSKISFLSWCKIFRSTFGLYSMTF